MKAIKNYLKNIPGKKQKGKYVLFLVDDYGNLRISSQQSVDRLRKSGVKLTSRFDTLDALECCQDFDALFEVLRNHQDKRGSHPSFTTFNLVANVNFEASAQAQHYIPESLSDTYLRIHGDAKIWDYWKQGIKEGLLSPEFHGREHLNVQAVNELFNEGDKTLKLNIEYQSFAGILPPQNSGGIHPYASYDTNGSSPVDALIEITRDGLCRFEEEFGFPAIGFAAPRGADNVRIEQCLFTNGIRLIDRQLIQDSGKGKKLNYSGKRFPSGLTSYVRNSRFEPGITNPDLEIRNTLAQVRASFMMRNVAIISSHRANFSGAINEKNRKNGLDALDKLLTMITTTWPDVQFIDLRGLSHLLK